MSINPRIGILPAIMLPMLAAVVVLGLLSVSINIYLHKSESLKIEKQQMAERVDSYHVLINHLTSVADYVALKQALPAILSDQNIVWARVVSQYGTTIAEAGSQSQTPQLDKRKLYLANNPESTLGQLEMEYHYPQPFSAVLTTPSVLSTLVALTLLAFLVSAVIWYVVIRPLNDIAATAENLKNNNWQLEQINAPLELKELNNVLKNSTGLLRNRTEALEQANLVLQQQIREIDQVQAKLAHAQKLETVGSLTSGLAHDFNNLLAVIFGNLELEMVDEKNNGDNPSVYLSSARDATQQASNYIKGLMAFSRKEDIHREKIEPGELIESLSQLLRPAVRSSIALNVHRAAEATYCYIDKSRLSSCVLNLVKNSADAIPRDGEISVTTARYTTDAPVVMASGTLNKGNYVTVQVQDTGTGMSENVVENAFIEFFTTKERNKGTGLGLAMVAQFAHDAGGQVDIQTVLGEGTSITIYLPESSGIKHAEQETENGSDTALLTRKKVLLVEDNYSVASILIELIKRFDCESKHVGILDKVVEINQFFYQFDLVICDLDLPGRVQGIDLIEIWKDLKEPPTLVFLSGSNVFEIDRKLLENSGHALFAKPISATVLKKILLNA